MKYNIKTRYTLERIIRDAWRHEIDEFSFQNIGLTSSVWTAWDFLKTIIKKVKISMPHGVSITRFGYDHLSIFLSSSNNTTQHFWNIYIHKDEDIVIYKEGAMSTKATRFSHVNDAIDFFIEKSQYEM